MISSDIVNIISAAEVLEVEMSNWQFGTVVEWYVFSVEKTIVFYTQSSHNFFHLDMTNAK